jgi:hypothetical protein
MNVQRPVCGCIYSRVVVISTFVRAGDPVGLMDFAIRENIFVSFSSRSTDLTAVAVYVPAGATRMASFSRSYCVEIQYLAPLSSAIALL